MFEIHAFLAICLRSCLIVFTDFDVNSEGTFATGIQKDSATDPEEPVDNRGIAAISNCCRTCPNEGFLRQFFRQVSISG